jgi:hypothetical protein
MELTTVGNFAFKAALYFYICLSRGTFLTENITPAVTGGKVSAATH